MVFALGQAAILGYPFVDKGVVTSVWYLVVAALGLGMCLYAVVRQGGPLRRVWLAVTIGAGLFFLGDLLWTLEDIVWRVDPFPSIADVFYLAGYPALGIGVAWLVRGRQPGGDRAALIDAAIVTTGLGVVIGVEVMLPALTDSSASVLSRAVSTAYPVGDLLLVAIVARLAITPGRRLLSFWALGAACLAMLLTDAIYNVLVIAGTDAGAQPWLDVGWAQLYLLLGLAAAHPSAAELTDQAADHHGVLGRLRLSLLTSAAVLAPGTLLLQVVRDRPLFPVFVAVGSITLFLLVVLRIAGLLRQVQTQSTLLEQLASRDALTGLPNRGAWDHELARMLGDAHEHGRDLVVVLLDLDHFKRYNDTKGHLAGDRLLQELSSVWRSHLAGRGVLTRYGGEEFALALPAIVPEDAEALLRELCRVVPDGQTASAGLAVWRGDESVADLMSRVDSALYSAKRAGRDAIRVAGSATATAGLDGRLRQELVPRSIFQPIVELAGGAVVGVEALSRFDTSTLAPDEVFARAWLRGNGPELEAAAIRSALASREIFGTTAIHINVSARALLTAQVQAALPEDLHGVVLEMTEQDVSADSSDTRSVLQELRARGAILAIDDFGVGFSNLRRMIRVRPEIIKLDRSLVDGIEHDGGTQSVIAAVAAQAAQTNRRLCAEGVEIEAEREALMALGVPHGQGYLFSPPVPALDALAMIRRAGHPVRQPT